MESVKQAAQAEGQSQPVVWWAWGSYLWRPEQPSPPPAHSWGLWATGRGLQKQGAWGVGAAPPAAPDGKVLGSKFLLLVSFSIFHAPGFWMS